MTSKDFVEISDLDSMKKALENAEIYFTELEQEECVILETEYDIVMVFNRENDQLLYMDLKKDAQDD